jgi:hypothetical protein
MKCNFRIAFANLLAASIFLSLIGCKKDVSSLSKLDVERSVPVIAATYPAKYFDNVNKLIRQGKNYYSFENLPGWKVVDEPTMPKKSDATYRTSADGDESDAFVEYDESEMIPYYYYGSEAEENQYFPGSYPDAEDLLYPNYYYNNGYYSQIVGNDFTMNYGGEIVPRAHDMTVYKTGTFTKRNVYIQVRLHFLYARISNGSGNVKFTYAVVPSDKGTYWVTGTKMGELDESAKTFAFNLDKTGYGDFLGSEIKETRTVIYSVEGSMKVSSNVNVGAFQVGAELGAGFTINSATHTYTYYTIQGTIEMPSEGMFTTPTYQINFSGNSFGIAKE